MNILFIHQYFTTREGTGGTRSYEFARHLVKSGHKVTMLAGAAHLRHVPAVENGGMVVRTKIDGIDVISIRVGYSNYMGYEKRLLSFVKFMVCSTWASLWLKDIDVVYASSTPLTVGIVGWLASAWHRVPFVFEVRDLWPEYIEDFGLTKNRPMLAGMRKVSAFLYKRANRVVAISDSMNKRLQTLYPEARDKVDTIPLGADIDYDEGGGIKLPELPPGTLKVVFAGTLGYVVAVDRMLMLASKLKDDGVAFLVAGDGKMKPSLLKLKEDLKLDNVHFLGRLNKKQVFGLIKQADLCFISHRYMDETGRVYINCMDCLTNKFFDYIACGKPVLINHDSESTSYIEKFRCGVRLPHDDYDAAARAVLRLKRDPALRRSMGENARRLACDRFDRKKMAESCERLLGMVVSEAARGQRPAWTPQ
jgi:glycosyltransferase involved in cell wall biosynthesis